MLLDLKEISRLGEGRRTRLVVKRGQREQIVNDFKQIPWIFVQERPLGFFKAHRTTGSEKERVASLVYFQTIFYSLLLLPPLYQPLTIHLYFPSLYKYLSIYYVPETVLGVREKVISKLRSVTSKSLHASRGRQVALSRKMISYGGL